MIFSNLIYSIKKYRFDKENEEYEKYYMACRQYESTGSVPEGWVLTTKQDEINLNKNIKGSYYNPYLKEN